MASSDTQQGQEWQLSRWKCWRPSPRANCTPVSVKNSPSSALPFPFSVLQLSSLRSDTSALEAPSQITNTPSHIHPLATEDTSASPAPLVTKAKITSHVSLRMFWVITLSLNLSQSLSLSQTILVHWGLPQQPLGFLGPRLKPDHHPAPRIGAGEAKLRPSPSPRA